MALALFGIAAGASGARPQATHENVTRVDRTMFVFSETIRGDIVTLDHLVFLGPGVTLTLIGDDIRRGGHARVTGPGKLVVLTTDQLGSLDAQAVEPARNPGGALLRVSPSGTNLRFELARPDEVTIEIFDAQGRRMRSDHLGTLAAGEHLAALSDRATPTGVYLYRIRAGSESRTGRVFLTH